MSNFSFHVILRLTLDFISGGPLPLVSLVKVKAGTRIVMIPSLVLDRHQAPPGSAHGVATAGCYYITTLSGGNQALLPAPFGGSCGASSNNVMGLRRSLEHAQHLLHSVYKGVQTFFQTKGDKATNAISVLVTNTGASMIPSGHHVLVAERTLTYFCRETPKDSYTSSKNEKPLFHVGLPRCQNDGHSFGGSLTVLRAFA